MRPVESEDGDLCWSMQIHLLLFLFPRHSKRMGVFCVSNSHCFQQVGCFRRFWCRPGKCCQRRGNLLLLLKCYPFNARLLILSNQPQISHICWTSLKLSWIYNTISSISIPFMPKAAVFYFQLKIFSMLSCCKCEPQISNMINSSNQVDKPTLLYPHSLHPTQAGLAEAHHRLRTFKTSVSSEVQGVTNTEVPWLLLCLGWIHGYRL